MAQPAAPADAAISTFTGTMTGSEPQAYEVDNSTCTVIEPLYHYYQTFNYTVTETGTYQYTDLSILYDLDMQLAIFAGSYDPNSVLTNCVTRFDDYGSVSLTAGQEYVFVVQPLFDLAPNTGVWEYQMDGPGQVIPFSQYVAPDISASQQFPQIGLVSISTAQAQPIYETAAGGVVRNAAGSEIWLPQDYDGNGFDTYLVMSSQEIDGRTWLEIFLGDGEANAWVPLDQVTPLSFEQTEYQ